jgi:hypothetical protein
MRTTRGLTASGHDRQAAKSCPAISRVRNNSQLHQEHPLRPVKWRSPQSGRQFLAGPYVGAPRVEPIS